MKIGIFGGAFDPVHKEHKKIIEKSFFELGLDKILLLPSYSPPHKDCKISAFDDRIKMLEAETSDLEYVIIDKREYNTQNKTNCAFEVLKSIVLDYPNDELVYIVGGDSMIKFHTWVRPDIISRLMPIAVVARKGYDGLRRAKQNAIKKWGASIVELSIEGEDISSSLIKAQFELERKSPFVSSAVSKVINAQGLYTCFENIIKDLKASISNELFQHCKSTVFWAMGFANKLDLRYEDVFLAALLHDCAKEMEIPSKYTHIPYKVAHQFFGADIAKEKYNIDDENILSAIRYHTTGKADMSPLQKLVFCADMLEDLRDFSGVQRLREIINEDFEKGFYECVKQSIKRLEETGRDIYYLTLECYDYYKKKI